MLGARLLLSDLHQLVLEDRQVFYDRFPDKAVRIIYDRFSERVGRLSSSLWSAPIVPAYTTTSQTTFVQQVHADNGRGYTNDSCIATEAGRERADSATIHWRSQGLG